MTSNYYENCSICNGEGGVSTFCCPGIDPHDGSISCGCYGRGSWEDCNECNGTGKVITDTINWNYDSLELQYTHDHSKYYSIIGSGNFNKYIGTAVYTNGEFNEIIDIEKYEI
jgi:hypothetical protein